MVVDIERASYFHPSQAVAAPAKLTTEEAAIKYGFEILKTEFISEYNSDATLFRHKKTGAEVSFLQSNKNCIAVYNMYPLDLGEHLYAVCSRPRRKYSVYV